MSSDEAARRAYVSLDPSVDKAITLGFAGFNAATSANIPEQVANGRKAGTLSISGQVDQGTSANKGMRLLEKMASYSDDGAISFTTNDTSPPKLDMSLKSIPTGTLSGTLAGTYALGGDLSGTVTLDVSFSAQLQPNAADAKKVERKPGTTHVTGTLTTSDGGTYAVDVTR